jgi:hypothetical protein
VLSAHQYRHLITNNDSRDGGRILSSAYEKVGKVIQVGTVDLDTGELLEGTLVRDKEQTKHYWGANFVTVFQQALEATDELSGEEARVFLHLLRSLGANNEWRFLKPGEMAARLGMSRSQISRALRGLSEKKILLRGDRIGRTYAYSMNPHLGWKGFFGKHAAAKAQAPSLVAA